MDKYIALYSRVSDEIQIERGESIPRQKQLLEEEALRMGFARWVHFSDEAFSGKNTNRPGFFNMVEEIKAGRISYVIAYDLSRISRDEFDTFKFFDLLEKTQTSFKSLSSNYDMTTPEGKLMLGVSAATNAFFRRDLVRKVKDAMIKIHKDGRFTGGQPAFGFNVVEKKLVQCPEEAALLKKMYDKFEQTKSFRATTTWLNRSGYKTKKGMTWASSTVKRLLTNSLYCGLQTFGKRIGSNDKIIQPKDKWIITKGNFEPIITVEQFDRVQAIIESRGYTARPKGKFVYLLNGILFCDKCHGKMYGCLHLRPNGKTHFYYRCVTEGQKGICKAASLRGYELEGAVLDEIKRRVKLHFTNDEINQIETKTDWQEELTRVERAIKDCETKEGRLYDLIADGKGTRSKIEEKIYSITAERNGLTIRRLEIIGQNNPDAAMARRKIYEDLAALNGDVVTLPRLKLFTILREIIEKVTAGNDNILIDMYEVE